MYTDQDLDAAVAAGVLSSQTATEFRSFLTQRHPASGPDEEAFRLLSGFNDIFVAIASSLLLAAVWSIGGSIAPGFAGLSCATVSWGLAEFFVRKRRMALPAILLLVAFVGGVFQASMHFIPGEHAVAAAGCLAALAATGHWLRFRVPITVAAGLLALIAGVLISATLAFPTLANWISVLTFAAGVATFTLALKWDASDVQRRTGRSDVAFWLHLLAAPLLVHPLFTALQAFEYSLGAPQVALVAGIYALIALISLMIDRRALMVSALGYVLYAFTALFSQTDLVDLGFASTALLVGSALLLLSAFWQRARAVSLGWLPDQIRRQLPPLR